MTELAPDSFVDLLRGLQAGESVAETRLLSDYLRRLTRIAAHELGGPFQAKVDPDAVAAAALNSFLRRYPESNWEFPDRQALWLLLARITRNKCAEKRGLLADKRDVRKEAATAAPSDPAADPSPDEVTAFRDLLHWLLNQGDEKDRMIMRMRLDGEDLSAISAKVQYSERTVLRRLEALRKALEKQLES